MHHTKAATYKWWVIGASTVALLSGAGYHWRSAIYNKMHPMVMQQLSTGVGQRKLISLSDGTQVWLGPATTLDYPQSFTRDVREMTVTGEAFIKVSSSTSRPFIIHANGVNTQTTDGHLTVQAYNNEAYVAVTLVKGNASVQVQDTVSASTTDAGQLPEGAAKQVALQANERAVFVKEENLIVKQKFASADKHMQARVNGTYEFWGMPANEVIKELSRQFQVPVELKGEYFNCKYYGELKANAPLDKFLKMFAESINATLTKENDTWVINSKGCQN
ncbi:anti-sigma factor [Filimonas lacunae]|nr:anti-sigma factor [Filimonas lacunae]